jgi:hypothetical protein
MTGWPERIGLVYRDSSGVESRRTVRISDISVSRGMLMLEGFCEMRKSPRCFRSDRIVSALDPESGEVFPDVAALLSSHPEFKSGRTWQKGWRGNRELEEMLQPLGYLASLTDGFVEDKAKLIYEFALAHWPMELPEAKRFLRHVYELDPIYTEIGDGLDIGVTDDARGRDFLEVVSRLAELDGEVTKREVTFFKRVRSAAKRNDAPEALARSDMLINQRIDGAQPPPVQKAAVEESAEIQPFAEPSNSTSSLLIGIAAGIVILMIFYALT